jgi:peroxiredoxin
MKSKLGNPAVTFELKDTNGDVHRLEDGLGHWQLLVFHRHLG